MHIIYQIVVVSEILRREFPGLTKDSADVLARKLVGAIS